MSSPRSGLGRVVATSAAAGLLLSACGLPRATAGPGQATPATEVTGVFQPPDVSVAPADRAHDIRLDSPITVRASGGRLDSVSVHVDGDPNQLSGHLSANHRGWTSSDPLDPGAHYVVEVSATSPGGDITSSRTTFTTMDADRLTTDVTPGDGDTVGVGMPIGLRFNADIPGAKQLALVSRLAVQAAPPVAGAWHWVTHNEVHFRPQTYWPAGAKVTVSARLKGFEAAGNHWGLANWSSSFTVGDKHVSIIDVGSHQMQVFQNDQLVQAWPISAGRPGRDTLGGILYVPYKIPDVLMDSLSIGIPRNSPDGYYDHVFWDTAISFDGFFIHAAPWSEGSQGSANVSHGCVNLSADRAHIFYDFSHVGDIVIVQNSPRPADYGDGEGDWQIPFEQYANSGGTLTPPPAHNVPGGV